MRWGSAGLTIQLLPQVLEFLNPDLARTSLVGIISDVRQSMMEETDFQVDRALSALSWMRCSVSAPLVSLPSWKACRAYIEIRQYVLGQSRLAAERLYLCRKRRNTSSSSKATWSALACRQLPPAPMYTSSTPQRGGAPEPQP